MPAQLKTGCPHCGASLNIKETHVGRRVRCPKCTQSFEVQSVHISSGDSRQDAPPSAQTIESSSALHDTASEQKPSLAAGLLGKIGRFELQEVLGQGAFGRVYRAFDPQLERLVALKVPIFAPDDKTRTRRFLTEAKAAGQLRHPHIVTTYESGEAEGHCYIAAQFVRGVTLAERLKSNPPPLRQAVQWVGSLADALAYAHEEGIVHRDIKPENIMIDEKDQPQIMDFGLARRLSEDSAMTVDGTILGTPAYMSPEQARGEHGNVGPRSDQYSLAAVFYELLTSRRPFEGAPHAVISQVLKDEPANPRTIARSTPRDLEAICLKAMSKEVSGRYATMTEFADDLRRYLADVPATARPAGVLERFQRWRRREPRVAWLTLTVALVLLAGIAVSSGLALHAYQQKQNAIAIASDLQTALNSLKQEKARADSENQRAISKTAEVLHAQTELQRKNTELQQALADAKDATARAQAANQSAAEKGLEAQNAAQIAQTADAARKQLELAAMLADAEVLIERDRFTESLALLESADAAMRTRQWAALKDRAENQNYVVKIQDRGDPLLIHDDIILSKNLVVGESFSPLLLMAFQVAPPHKVIWSRPETAVPGLALFSSPLKPLPKEPRFLVLKYGYWQIRDLHTGKPLGKAHTERLIKRSAICLHADEQRIVLTDGTRCTEHLALDAFGGFHDVFSKNPERKYGLAAVDGNGSAVYVDRERNVWLATASEPPIDVDKAERFTGLLLDAIGPVTRDGTSLDLAPARRIRVAGRRIVVGNEIGLREDIEVWEPGGRISVLQGVRGKLVDLTISPDGKWVAARSNPSRQVAWQSPSGAGSGIDSILVWDATTGKLKQVWSNQAVSGVLTFNRASQLFWQSGNAIHVWTMPPDIASESYDRIGSRDPSTEPSTLCDHEIARNLAQVTSIPLSYTTWDGEVHLADPAAEAVRNLTQHHAWDGAPAWSPDGTQMVFESNRNGRLDGDFDLFVMNADGSGLRQLTTSTKSDRKPTWSPDGRRICFPRYTRDPAAGWELIVINADGTGEVNITNDPAADGDPAWSPDGERIVFHSNRQDNSWYLYTTRPDGTEVQLLTRKPQDIQANAAWSPDGTQLAFTAKDHGRSEIFTCGADGKNYRQLTKLGGLNTYAAWSPDGQHIAFLHRPTSLTRMVSSLYVMRADGTDVRQIASEACSLDTGRPAWVPSATTISAR